MTGKIFRSCFLVVLAGIVLCAGLFLAVMARQYERQIWAQLEQEAAYLARGVEQGGKSYLDGLTPAQRLTWVGPDGAVRWDSAADPEGMENHLDREEIAQAMAEGTGRGSHVSNTLLEKTLYYALRLEDGSVLRVSCSRGTVGAMLLGVVQPVLWIVVAALVLSVLLAFRLAKQITRPINELDLEEPRLDRTYDELFPLVRRLREQNETIHRQMETLTRHQRELNALTENMSEGMLLLDKNYTVLSGNSSAFAMLGDRPKAIRRENCPEALWMAIGHAMAGERTETLIRKEESAWELLASPVTANGAVLGAVLLLVDVTEREERENLRRAFSANVSHELKTPLTAISGFAELIKAGLTDPEKTREFAGDIYKECRRLIELVDDIMKISRLDEGAPGLTEEAVDLKALTEEVLRSLEPAAARKGVTLGFTGESQEITGVRQLLGEMVYNLCENAIKYNKDDGSVAVTLTGHRDTVTLAVADTGIGIPPSQQNRVFERFYRGDRGRPVGGTGLGLSIVKHGAQYHNASLELESTPGEGTTITLTFERRNT